MAALVSFMQFFLILAIRIDQTIKIWKLKIALVALSLVRHSFRPYNTMWLLLKRFGSPKTVSEFLKMHSAY